MMITMNDLVTLVFCMKSGVLNNVPITRRMADALIGEWVNARETVLHKSDDDRIRKAVRFLRFGTIANQGETSGGERYASCAIAVDQIAAIFIKSQTQLSPQDKLVEVLEKQMRNESRGDDWRDGPDNPER